MPAGQQPVELRVLRVDENIGLYGHVWTCWWDVRLRHWHLQLQCQGTLDDMQRHMPGRGSIDGHPGGATDRALQAQQATLCGRGNQVTIHNADGSTSTVALSTSIKCPAGQCCHMAPVNVGNGLSGAITMSSSATSTTVVRRRLLQSSGGSTNQQILINPAAVCLNLHDGIMFQINGTSYPVYQKVACRPVV